MAIINNINNPIKPEKLNSLINNLELLDVSVTKLNSHPVLNWPLMQDKHFSLPSLVLPPVKYYDENLSIPSPY